MIDSLPSISEQPANLMEVLRSRATWFDDRVAYRFCADGELDESITFGDLDRRAQAIAVHLDRMAQAGERALLLFPAGLDFISAFFGCVYAGVLAVPTCYPKAKRPMSRLSAIARDSEATVVLTNSKTLEMVSTACEQSDLRHLSWVPVDRIADDLAGQWACPTLDLQDVVFLQYTSGSTSSPKGVMVTNGNLIHNLEAIRQGFQLEFMHPEACELDKGVFWLPAYHDMGLIGGILTSLYVGGQSLLMSPTDFLRRPIRWLKAISDNRASVSGAPSFAYELCVQKTTQEQRAGLDLSSWQISFCGAEPIRAETLDRFVKAFEPYGFSPSALYPCYGLAESTLLATGSEGPSRYVTQRCLRGALANHRVARANNEDGDQVRTLVSCGSPRLDHRIEIVKAEGNARCEPSEVGEIWIQGPSVAVGYWNRPEETKATFEARLNGSDEGPFLRTGDLGFFSDGNLFVTGRVKDVIIIRGRNLYPQDIEATVASAHHSLRLDAGAAIPLDVDGEEQLGIVHEVDRSFRRGDLTEVVRLVRRVIIEEHEVDPHAIILIRHASLPMTTSGKVQRAMCRQQYLDGELRVLHEWVNETDSAAGVPKYRSPVDAAGNENGTAERVGDHAAGQVKGSAPESQESGQGANSNGRSATSMSAHQKRSNPAILQLDGRAMTADEVDRLCERIESWLIDWLMDRARVPRDEIHQNKPFAEYGLDSLTAVEMSRDIEDWLGVQVTATIAWNYPTAAAMAQYLAHEVVGVPAQSPHAAATPPAKSDSDFEQMLTEIETMSDDEVERLLAQKSHTPGEQSDG